MSATEQEYIKIISKNWNSRSGSLKEQVDFLTKLYGGTKSEKIIYSRNRGQMSLLMKSKL